MSRQQLPFHLELQEIARKNKCKSKAQVAAVEVLAAAAVAGENLSYTELARRAGSEGKSNCVLSTTGHRLANSHNVQMAVREALSSARYATPKAITSKLDDLVDCGHRPTEFRALQTFMEITGFREQPAGASDLGSALAALGAALGGQEVIIALRPANVSNSGLGTVASLDSACDSPEL